MAAGNRRTRPYRWITAIIPALLVVPTAVPACPRCFESSGPRVLAAYYLSTALLSLLPFAIIGSIGLIAFRFARRAREQDRETQTPLDASVRRTRISPT